ncbi:MAG: peptidylprolyl isomerase [Candidatus Thiodiazotropha sp.]
MHRLNNIDSTAKEAVQAASLTGWRLLPPVGEGSVRSRTALLHWFIVLLTLLLSTGMGDARSAESDATEKEIFATVNGEAIEMSTYRSMVHMGARQRFYHGQPPEADLKAYRKEVGDQLIDELVLHQEALRRGIEPDPEQVKREVEINIKRLASQAGWQEAKEKLLPVLRQGLERHDRIRQLKDEFRSEAPQASEAELHAFYNANLDKFTSPPQTRIAMILLKVPPWGDADLWRQKREALTAIKHKISGEMEFSEAAKRYSDDSSASNGGDMGYLHQGMLGTQAEEAIYQLESGDISEPITLLEGVALFHLMERLDARINPLDKVRQRALELLMRERRETFVADNKRRLRNSADIRYAVPDYYEQRQEVSGRSNKNKS